MLNIKNNFSIYILSAGVLFSAQFLSLKGFSQTAKPAAGVFTDYDAMAGQWTVRVASMLKNGNVKGMNTLKRQSKLIKENDPISAILPPALKIKLAPEALYELCEKSTLVIGKYSKKASFLASGIVLTEDGICATNYHVLAEIITGGFFNSYDLANTDSLRFAAAFDGKVYPVIEILGYIQDADLAIFKLDTHGEKLSPIAMGDTAPVGASVNLISHPDGNLYMYSRGYVARNTANTKTGFAANRMEVTLEYAKGSSGAPLFDDYGNLVGMVSTTRPIYYEKETEKNQQMVLRHTIPVSSIKSLFKRPI